MLQRLLETESLSGPQWAIVLGLSLVTRGLVWIDKTIGLARQNKAASSLSSPPQPTAKESPA